MNLNKKKLYIGNLSNKIKEVDLRNLCSPFGRISGIQYTGKHFGFVSFFSEMDALKAKEALNNTQFQDKVLVVNYSKINTDHDGSNMMQRGQVGRGMMDHRMQGGRMDFDGPFEESNDRVLVMNDGPLRNESVNDVEIICLNKHNRVYSESVESRLKHIGLMVDILFPNPEIPLAKVLGSIAKRGVMFAVCVAPENELHRSLTVNVLQGEQQEHRNMPIEESIQFIAKSFGSIIKKPMSMPGFNNSVGAMGSSGFSDMGGPKRSIHGVGGHPQDIQTILGFLVDDRPMSIMEYDKLIKYLVNRREDTLKAEYGSNIPAHLLLPPVGPGQDPVLKAKQEEIQTRVMEILNRRKIQFNCPDSGSQVGSETSSAPASNAAAALTPALQQAIDSLMKSGPSLLDTLKGLDGGR